MYKLNRIKKRSSPRRTVLDDKHLPTCSCLTWRVCEGTWHRETYLNYQRRMFWVYFQNVNENLDLCGFVGAIRMGTWFLWEMVIWGRETIGYGQNHYYDNATVGTKSFFDSWKKSGISLAPTSENWRKIGSGLVMMKITELSWMKYHRGNVDKKPGDFLNEHDSRHLI